MISLVTISWVPWLWLLRKYGAWWMLRVADCGPCGQFCSSYLCLTLVLEYISIVLLEWWHAWDVHVGPSQRKFSHSCGLILLATALCKIKTNKWNAKHQILRLWTAENLTLLKILRFGAAWSARAHLYQLVHCSSFYYNCVCNNIQLLDEAEHAWYQEL